MKKNLLLFLLCIACSSSFAQTIFSLRADGTILKNNQPFFPMGFYIDRASINSYKSQVNSIASAGTFNIINLPHSGTSAEWTSFLDLCASKNMYVIKQLNYTAPVYDDVDLFKNHSAVYGWSIADDGDAGTFTYAQLQDRHNQCKIHDSKHLTEMALTGYYVSRRNAVDNYTAISDVCEYEIYPITPPSDYDVTSSNALTQTYLRTLLYVKSAAKVNKPMIMNTQYFSWGGQSPNPRYPTAAEVRNMTYSGLAAGIKGIIAYSFSNNLVNQTAEWNEIKVLRTDVSTLESILLNGKLTRVNIGDQELVSSYWEYNNECYVVVVNTSYNTVKNSSITLPATYIGPAQTVFPRMPNSMTFSGGKLSGSINPTDVQVYNNHITTSKRNLFCEDECEWGGDNAKTDCKQILLKFT